MQRRIVTVPHALMRLTSADWSIDWRGQRAGEANDGTTQVVYNAFPRWVASPELFLHGETLRAWRAIRASARGMTGVYRIRMCDPIGFARASIGAPADWLSGGIPTAEGNTLASGQGLLVDPFVLVTYAAPAGSEILDVDATPAGGVPPRQGQIMSINDWPFLVTSVTPRGGPFYRLGLEMPLREAVAPYDPVRMIATGLFEAIEEDMGNPAYDAGRTSRVRLSLREVLAR